MPGDQTFGQQLQPHVGSIVQVRTSELLRREDKKVFEQQLQSRRGSLVQVRTGGLTRSARNFSGKIGILVRVDDDAVEAWQHVVQVWVLIDDSVKKLILYPEEIELIGADDV